MECEGENFFGVDTISLVGTFRHLPLLPLLPLSLFSFWPSLDVGCPVLPRCNSGDLPLFLEVLWNSVPIGADWMGVLRFKFLLRLSIFPGMSNHTGEYQWHSLLA